MKTRFSLLMSVMVLCQLIVAQTHITISDPETWTTDELKPYVGQTVIFDTPMIIAANDLSSSALTIAPRILFTGTNQAYPRTAAYQSVVSMNGKGMMELSGLSGAYAYRCRGKIYNLKADVISTNKLSYKSGTWVGDKRSDLEANFPDLGDYRLLICTMNLENYFVANNNHSKQRDKIINALSFINADVIGLVELEGGTVGLQEITDYLNARLPGRAYRRSDNDGGNTYQTVAFIYDSKKVKPYGAIQASNTRTNFRKKMWCFEELGTGEQFIFSVNHFKAKSGNGTGTNANQNDGQGAWNADRVEEAQSIIDLHKRIAPQLKEKDILIMGDLNAYAKEDPIKLMLDNGMIDLHRAFHADSSYSYQFGGLAGYLDHAICNATMFPQVTGMAALHINSDENDRYTYDKSSGDNTMFRCSDHDPVLVGLKLDNTAIYDPKPAVNTIDIYKGSVHQLVINDAYRAGGQDSYYAIYDVSGRSVKSAKIEKNSQTVDLPSAPGVYILYVYYETQVYPYKFIVR